MNIIPADVVGELKQVAPKRHAFKAARRMFYIYYYLYFALFFFLYFFIFNH